MRRLEQVGHIVHDDRSCAAQERVVDPSFASQGTAVRGDGAAPGSTATGLADDEPLTGPRGSEELLGPAQRLEEQRHRADVLAPDDLLEERLDPELRFAARR